MPHRRSYPLSFIFQVNRHEVKRGAFFVRIIILVTSIFMANSILAASLVRDQRGMPQCLISDDRREMVAFLWNQDPYNREIIFELKRAQEPDSKKSEFYSHRRGRRGPRSYLNSKKNLDIYCNPEKRIYLDINPELES